MRVVPNSADYSYSIFIPYNEALNISKGLDAKVIEDSLEINFSFMSSIKDGFYEYVSEKGIANKLIEISNEEIIKFGLVHSLILNRDKYQFHLILEDD